jgi:hypothetical protein
MANARVVLLLLLVVVVGLAEEEEERRVVKWRTAEASLSGLPVAKPWLGARLG